MATFISDEVKTELVNRGLWGDFVKIRQDLRDTEGLSAQQASKAVMDRLAPDLTHLVRNQGRPPKKTKDAKPQSQSQSQPGDVVASGESTPSVPSPSPSPSPVGSLAERRFATRNGKLGGASSSGASPSLIDRKTFEGRSCSLSTAFMWAYANLSIADVGPAEAPSAVAWQLLVDMRSSPAMRADLLKSGLSAAMRRAETEEDAGNRFDGEGEYDALRVIAESQGGTQT